MGCRGPLPSPPGGGAVCAVPKQRPQQAVPSPAVCTPRLFIYADVRESDMTGIH